MCPLPARAQKVLWLLFVAVTVLFLLCLILLKIQGRALTGILPPCSLYSRTGICCAGCGGTRAIQLLLQGQWLQSARYHILVPYTAVVGGAFLLSPILRRIIGRPFLLRPLYFYLAILLTLGQWGIRLVMTFSGHSVF